MKIDTPVNQMLTTQQVFDKVVTHLKQQGRGSFVYDTNGKTPLCRYRTDEGLMCAAGCLIADENYHQSMEGTSSLFTDVQNALRDSGISLTDRTDKVISELQCEHDWWCRNAGHAPFDNVFWNYIQKIGYRYNLSVQKAM